MENVKAYINDLSAAWFFEKHKGKWEQELQQHYRQGVSTSNQWRKIEERGEMINRNISSLV